MTPVCSREQVFGIVEQFLMTFLRIHCWTGCRRAQRKWSNAFTMSNPWGFVGLLLRVAYTAFLETTISSARLFN
jgi:hypothetical protein